MIAIPKYATEPITLYTSSVVLIPASLLFSEDNAYAVRVLVHVCMCKHPIPSCATRNLDSKFESCEMHYLSTSDSVTRFDERRDLVVDSRFGGGQIVVGSGRSCQRIVKL